MIELPNMGHATRFYCTACPYVCPIERGVKIKRKQILVRKGIEPVISSDDMKNAPTTEGITIFLFFFPHNLLLFCSIIIWL